MKISIVTLSFNQCAYLKAAMDSILDQGYHDLEYIVVDPGSSDGSRELIQNYSSKISKVILEPDRGAADGLNKGFAVATGDLYGFLNADDLLLPGSLHRVADFFDQHPQRDFVMGNGYIIDSKGGRVRPIRARNFKMRPICYRGSDWLQQSTFFRRELFLRSEGFNVENRTCWDGELFANMVSVGAKVGYIDEDLSQFRIYASSITGSGKFKEQYRKDIDRIFARYQGHSWGPVDEVWKHYYRVGRLVSHASYYARKWVKGMF